MTELPRISGSKVARLPVVPARAGRAGLRAVCASFTGNLALFLFPRPTETVFTGPVGIETEKDIVPKTSSDISEPKKWALKHLQQERHHLRAAPMAFGLIFLIGFLAGWVFTWQIVVPSKNASIETLQISDNAKKSKIDDLQKENDRLVKQNTDLKAATSDRATTLKKRTTVLVNQLSEFAKTHAKDADTDALQDVFRQRFSGRVSGIVKELDEAGQHSDRLSQPRIYSEPSSTTLQTISDELQKLANKLQE